MLYNCTSSNYMWVPIIINHKNIQCFDNNMMYTYYKSK